MHHSDPEGAEKVAEAAHAMGDGGMLFAAKQLAALSISKSSISNIQSQLLRLTSAMALSHFWHSSCSLRNWRAGPIIAKRPSSGRTRASYYRASRPTADAGLDPPHHLAHTTG